MSQNIDENAVECESYYQNPNCYLCSQVDEERILVSVTPKVLQLPEIELSDKNVIVENRNPFSICFRVSSTNFSAFRPYPKKGWISPYGKVTISVHFCIPSIPIAKHEEITIFVSPNPFNQLKNNLCRCCPWCYWSFQTKYEDRNLQKHSTKKVKKNRIPLKQSSQSFELLIICRNCKKYVSANEIKIKKVSDLERRYSLSRVLSNHMCDVSNYNPKELSILSEKLASINSKMKDTLFKNERSQNVRQAKVVVRVDSLRSRAITEDKNYVIGMDSKRSSNANAYQQEVMFVMPKELNQEIKHKDTGRHEIGVKNNCCIKSHVCGRIVPADYCLKAMSGDDKNKIPEKSLSKRRFLFVSEGNIKNTGHAKDEELRSDVTASVCDMLEDCSEKMTKLEKQYSKISHVTVICLFLICLLLLFVVVNFFCSTEVMNYDSDFKYISLSLGYMLVIYFIEIVCTVYFE